MSDTDRNTVELVAEAAAYRAAYKLVLDAMAALIALHPTEDRASLTEAVRKRLHEKKGEYLFSAPLELTPELQADANTTFQTVFSELSAEIVNRTAGK